MSSSSSGFIVCIPESSVHWFRASLIALISGMTMLTDAFTQTSCGLSDKSVEIDVVAGHAASICGEMRICRSFASSAFESTLISSIVSYEDCIKHCGWKTHTLFIVVTQASAQWSFVLRCQIVLIYWGSYMVATHLHQCSQVPIRLPEVGGGDREFGCHQAVPTDIHNRRSLHPSHPCCELRVNFNKTHWTPTQQVHPF